MKYTFPPESKPLEGYTIKRAVGRGGFGEVYYALSDAGKEVALKFLVQNMDVELRGVSQCLNLKHPNLVTIFDIRQDQDQDHWIIMEYVSGKSLDEILDNQNGPMPIDQIQFWLKGIVAGLSFLHDRGIVHRDLKPANVYNEDSLVKIGDIGLAKYISQSRRNAQTESVGTVYYMAPEVAHGQYGHEVDVYSLGVVLYEMLTGKLPFDGESTGEILMKHLTEKPDLKPVPPQFHSVISRALEKDPQKRTPSINQLGMEFEQANNGNPPVLETSGNRSPKTEHKTGSAKASSAPDEGIPKLKHHAKEFGKEAEKYARKYSHEAQVYAKKMAKNAQDFAEKQKHTHNEWVKKQGQHKPVTQRPPAPKKRPTTESKDNPVLKIIISLLAIFFVGSLMGIRPMRSMLGGSLVICFYGGLIYLTYKFIAWIFGWGKHTTSNIDITDPAMNYGSTPQSDQYNHFQPEIRSDVQMNSKNEKRHNKKGFKRKKSYVYYGPNTLRVKPAIEKTNALLHSMLYSMIVASIISLSLYGTGFLSNSIPLTVGFGITTLLGSWMIMISAKIWEGNEVDSTTKRIIQMSLGGLLGFAVYYLHQFLNINIQNSYFNIDFEPVHRWGALVLFKNNSPTLMAFILFFAGLFFFQRWWLQADSFRKKRLRIRTVIGTLFFAFIASGITLTTCSIPLTWMVAISCIVQLSSEWIPRSQRHHIVQNSPSNQIS